MQYIVHKEQKFAFVRRKENLKSDTGQYPKPEFVLIVLHTSLSTGRIGAMHTLSVADVLCGRVVQFGDSTPCKPYI
jgi:hypothetical protein